MINYSDIINNFENKDNFNTEKNCKNCNKELDYFDLKASSKFKEGNNIYLFCKSCSNDLIKIKVNELKNIFYEKIDSLFENKKDLELIKNILSIYLNNEKNIKINLENNLIYILIIQKLEKKNLILKENGDLFFKDKEFINSDIIFLEVFEEIIKEILSEKNDFKKYLGCFICKDCNYIWKSKKLIGVPSKCPNCNLKNINRITSI